MKFALFTIAAAMVSSAPAVHIPKEKLVVWRLEAKHAGRYDVDVVARGQSVRKLVVVSSGMEKISPIRLRGSFWERILSSAEPALPDSGAIEAVSVAYPERDIPLLGMQWNWIVLFFIVSLIAGFVFKSVLGVQI